jgi:hypothetical protein
VFAMATGLPRGLSRADGRICPMRIPMPPPRIRRNARGGAFFANALRLRGFWAGFDVSLSGRGARLERDAGAIDLLILSPISRSPRAAVHSGGDRARPSAPGTAVLLCRPLPNSPPRPGTGPAGRRRGSFRAGGFARFPPRKSAPVQNFKHRRR